MLRDEDIIVMLYCAISDTLGKEDQRHPQGNLWLSEILLCGVLWALKGGGFCGFYRWLTSRDLFTLPERSRLHKLLKTHQHHHKRFLAEPTFFNAMDTFGIEIIRPIREGRSAQSTAITWKGKSGHRWIIGRKVAVRMNGNGEIVNFDEATANVFDARFNELADDDTCITLADSGFKNRKGIPDTLKICKRGEWNERMLIETLFSLWERVCNAKRMFVRSTNAFKTRVAYLVTLTNLTVKLNNELGLPNQAMAHYTL